MENLLYISAFIVALAIVLFVIYLAAVLLAVKRTLNSVAGTLENVQVQMKGITAETEELLNRTNRLAEDIETKTAKLNPIFDGLKETGGTISELNHSIRNLAARFSGVTAVAENEKAVQAAKWVTSFVRASRKRKDT